MLSKTLLSLAITASVAGLSGCDNISSVTDNDKATPESQVVHDSVREGKVTHVFDALNSVFALGTDLIFAAAASTDGTANVGDDGGNPVLNALNDLDGGISTLAPIDLNLTGSIDPASIDTTNVFLVRLPNQADAATMTLPLIELDENGDFVGAYNDAVAIDADHTKRQMTASDLDALSLATIGALFSQLKADGTAPAAATETVAFSNLAAIAASQLSPVTDYKVEVITQDGIANSTIRIVPLKPLDAKTKYITVLTSGVTDADGEAIMGAETYDQVTGTGELFSPALAPVRALYQNLEALATTIITVGGSQLTLLSGDIVSTTARTTVDPATVLKSMAYPGYWAESAIVGNNATAAAGIIAQAADGDATKTATYAGMVAVAEANGLTNDDATIFTAGYLASAAYVQPSLSTPQARKFAFIDAKLANGLSTDQVPLIALNAATAAVGGASVLISQGAIELPQYTTSLATNANSTWQANTAVGAALDTLQGNVEGTTPPKDVEGDTNVTYRYPFAEQQRMTVVPLLFVEPTDTAKATTFAALGATVSACTKGANGWPVIIAQHGFTVNRAGTLLTAASLANSTCSVVVAMDLPHHGIAPQTTDRDGVDIDSSTRAFTTTYNAFTSDAAASEYSPWAVAANALATADDTSILNSLAERHEELYLNDLSATSVMSYDATALAGQSGDFFIRVTNFQRFRDNLRQSVMDLLNLNATLSTIDIDGVVGADLDVSQVSYVGHSLGGIVGTAFVAVNNDAKVQLASKLVGTLDTSGDVILPKITEAVLATPGGGFPKLAESSVSLGAPIKAGLLVAAGIEPGDISFESFLNVLQATLDTADPLNFISDLAAGGVSATPTMMIEMIGGATIADGTTTEDDVSLPSTYLASANVYPADFVVPNNTSSNTDESARVTLAGTDPMITLLGSTQVPSTASTTTVTSYPISKFTAGTHGTFSSADAAIAFSEMMTETASFILTSGASVTTSAASSLVLDNSAD